MNGLLTTIGSPDTLAGVDTIYTPVKRHIRDRKEIRYGAERDDRLLGEVPVPLYRTLTGDGPAFHIRVHDDVSDDTSVELQVNLGHYSPNDAVSVTLDGELLGEPALHRTGGEGHLSEDAWLVWKLDTPPGQTRHS